MGERGGVDIPICSVICALRRFLFFSISCSTAHPRKEVFPGTAAKARLGRHHEVDTGNFEAIAGTRQSCDFIANRRKHAGANSS